MPTVKAKKTVYILGAGFSMPAGGPNQAKLLEHVFAIPDTDPKVNAAKQALKDFMVDVMNVFPGRINEVTLEDIYTPLDRCLAEGTSFRGQLPSQLQALQNNMEFLISVAIDKAIDLKGPAAKKYVEDFAGYLVDQAAVRSDKAAGKQYADDVKSYDPFSVISLNWDILLDKELYRALERKDCGMDGDYDPIGVVDYCCYISSIKKGERRIRTGLWALGARGYNVKLLKIHGSMNWLQCSNCQRLFVSFDEKINISNYINVEECRHCDDSGIKAILQGSLVMPTFLKDLSNFQIKLVWQNAAVEIMEADRLVFIGYSLPHADFEFRQVLSRMVKKDAEIHAVLYKEPGSATPGEYEQTLDRYTQFFSGHIPTFEDGGVNKFVASLV